MSDFKLEIMQRLRDIEIKYSLPYFEKDYSEKDWACMEYRKIIFDLVDRIEELESIIIKMDNNIKLDLSTYIENSEIL